jgi:hypothetical protein
VRHIRTIKKPLFPTVRFGSEAAAQNPRFDRVTNLDCLNGLYMFAREGSRVFIDDVMITAVPVPAAVWLFGSALAGLGWMRRKTTV